MVYPYASVKAHFAKVANVTVNTAPERVDALMADGRGLPYDPGTGRVMRNMVLVPAAQQRFWKELCEEAATEAL